ncbi:nuclear transport factor 2 family protein [Patulibacter minatonensis]|uniref:nuclear transport factor 2 family protein n=1 Tax=Patulibacter minatonensis TaxID=298163 RepID=UPI00047B4646|nr:nuclear transport factor 2 family protein [Patulibacter minatonensis]
MSTGRNIEHTKRIYDAVPAGDVETVFALLDPDVVIRYYGVEGIPYSGVFTGTAGATEFFTRVAAHIEIVAMEAWTFIADGDELAVWGHQNFRRLSTGQEFESDFAHIITMRDGRWLHFRDFMNSAVTARVFGV